MSATPAEYDEAGSRLDSAIESFTSDRRAVEAVWQPDASDAGRVLLDESLSTAKTVRGALDRQAEAHREVTRRAELVQRQVEETRTSTERSQELVDQATTHLSEVDAAVAECRDAISASSRTLQHALRIAGRAGAACGQASGSGALEGLMHNRVVSGRKREVWTMIATSVGIETVHFAAGEMAERLLGIPDGALPESFKAEVEEALKQSLPEARARITKALRDLADRG